MTISINNGKIYINGELSTDAELIGYALLDFSETLEDDGLAIELKEGDVFINEV